MDNCHLVSRNCGHQQISDEDIADLRRGPWTVEEDFTLINYIAQHGDGRWNFLARCAGLKRTGKSCRLRWLNYLRPEVRRGNITLEEQLLILELHSRWGNRWSKIAQHLPGRTDNEIKNYWRTRVQKHAKQLKCDVNSKQFKDTMRYLWMPRLAERIQAAAATGGAATVATTTRNCNSSVYQLNHHMGSTDHMLNMAPNMDGGGFHIYTPESSSAAASSDSFAAQVSPVSELTECYNYPVKEDNIQDFYLANQMSYCEQSLTTFDGYFNQGLDFYGADQSSQWMDGGDVSDSFWSVDDTWFLQQHLNTNV